MISVYTFHTESGWVARVLLSALRERMRQPGGEVGIGPQLAYLTRQIGTDADQGLRIEAIHNGGSLIIIDTFWSPVEYGLSERRHVELDHRARDYLVAMEERRRAAGWNGNLPAGVPIPAEHIHDFTAHTVTAFAPLKKGRRRHQTTTRGCCACALSEPMFDHLLHEALDMDEVTRK